MKESSLNSLNAFDCKTLLPCSIQSSKMLSYLMQALQIMNELYT